MWNCHLITNCISEQLPQQCCVAVHPKFQWLTATITYFSCSQVSGLAGTALLQAKGKLGLAPGFWSDSAVLHMSHCPAQWLPGACSSHGDHRSSRGKPNCKNTLKVSCLLTSASIPLAKASHMTKHNINGARVTLTRIHMVSKNDKNILRNTQKILPHVSLAQMVSCTHT